MNLRTTLALLLLTFSCQLFAVTNEFEFGNRVNEQRYLSYISKIRCLVCQNESLGSSRSDLAIDLRNEIYRLMAQGQSNEQIDDFLVSRYGDFILYQPPVKSSTLMLWFGPFVLLFVLLTLLLFRIKKMKNQPTTLSASEQQQARELLNPKEDQHD